MKARRRPPQSRPVTAAAPSTADLFAAAPRSMVRIVPAQGGAAPAARSRVPALWYAAVFTELTTDPHPPVPPHRSLQRLCHAAQRITPLVSMEMPNALLLEIRGSVRLFGSLAALLGELATTWQRLSMRAQWAAAPTTLAALWLARAGREVCLEDPAMLPGGLCDLPVSCTAWNAKSLETLNAMGVTRIGELLRLPRGGLARRLSPAAVFDLDVAIARQASPRRTFVPRVRFRERCEFDTEIESLVYLQMALDPLIEHCAEFLRSRQSGVQALELTLRHRILPATRVHTGLASVTSERHRLAAVMHEKLQRLTLPAPVRGMQLRSGTLQTLSADSLDVWTGQAAGGTAPQLMERLRARLGDAAVYGLRSVPEHRPEAAWRRVEASVRPVPGEPARDAAIANLMRPVWLLTEPTPLPAGLQPGAPPGLQLEEGPERIESGWWDGKDIARDYYVAREPQGARWWIYRERHTHAWYLHGVFA